MPKNANGTQKPFNAAKALRHISSIPWGPGRYLKLGGTVDDIAVWVDSSSSSGNSRASIATCRRAAYPEIENAGKLLPLRVLKGDSIAEKMHMVFFPDNIVGVEFNFYAPRIGRFMQYLQDKVPGPPVGARLPIRFEQLLRDDPLAKLEHWSALHALELRIRPSDVEELRTASKSLRDTFKSACGVGQVKTVSVKLTAESRKKGFARGLEMARDLFPRVSDRAIKFEVKGTVADTERVDTLDLLADVLSKDASIALSTTGSRSVDSQSAYKAIENAHQSLKGEIARAKSVTLVPLKEVTKAG